MNLQETIDRVKNWKAEKDKSGPVNYERNQEHNRAFNINAEIFSNTYGNRPVRLATLADLAQEAAQVARLMAAAPAMAEFTIQVLYSLTGECKAHHCAAPY